MSQLGTFVLSTEGVISACLIIILSAVWAIVSFGKRIFPIIEGLKEANQKISEYTDESNFAENFEEINTWIKQKPLLRFPWGEFTETLILEPGQKVKNTDDAETFFNESTLISPTVNLRFYNSLPNIITGGGILGTFIGLVFGVDEAAQKIAVTTASIAVPPEEAMKGLLHGASLAFTTSISGLGMSIVFSWFEKHYLNKALNLIRSWNLSLDERLERLTPERLAVDTFREVQQQTEELKTFNTQLIFSITQSLDANISGKLQPILAELLQVTKELRDNRETTTEEMLRSIVDEFKQAVQGAAGQEMAAMADTLKELNGKITDQTNGMADAHEKMLKGTGEILDKIGDVLHDSVEGLAKTLENLDATAEAMGAAANRFLGVTERLNNSFEQLETVSRRLENVSLTLEETSESLRTINSTQAETIESIKQSVDALRDSQAKVTETWQAYSDRFGDIDHSLAKFFTDLQQGVQDYTEHVQHFLGDIDQLLAQSIDKLGGATSEIQETAEGLENLLESMQETLKNILESSDKLGDSGDAVGASVNQLGHKLGAIENAFNRMVTSVTQGVVSDASVPQDVEGNA